MTGAEFKAIALQRLAAASPACREPQVFSDRPECNCWVGLVEAARIIEGITT